MSLAIPEQSHIEILNRITDAFFAVDSAWNFMYVNHEAARLLFRSQTDLIGKNIWDEFPEAIDLVFYDEYQRAMRDQLKVEFEAYFPPLKTWFEVRAYPSPNGLSVYFQDVTIKKEATLHKEQHYRSLFQYNPEAVFSMDLQGNYLSVNPAMERLLGYSEDEYLNMSFVPLVHTSSLLMTERHFTEAARGHTQHYETKTVHKDGRVIDVRVTNMPIVVNGTVVGVYGVAMDITQEKVNERKLLASEKLTAVGQLAASIAHEIRNPLTSLKGFLQLIRTNIPEVKSEYIKIMMDELTRIETITSELLILAKPQAVEFAYEDIGQILNDVITLLRSQALINRIEITHNDWDELPPVRCIGAQLKQVFINLIKNAIEAMQDGGEIQVLARLAAPGTLMIQVIDQGCGIPEAFLTSIGSPFYTTKAKGTGLGLTTTRKIIEFHGGSLEIASQVDKGTRVEIRIPVELLTVTR